MAPGIGLALRRVLGRCAPAVWCVPRVVGDAAEESASDGARPTLAADNQSGVNLLGDLIDRLGHRLVGLRDSSGRVVAAPAATRGALLGDCSRGRRLLLVDLALVGYGDWERAGSGQPHRRRHPYNQYHGIGGLDQFGRGFHAVFDASILSEQNNTGCFTAQPPVASIMQSRVRVLAAGLEDMNTRDPPSSCQRPAFRVASSISVAPRATFPSCAEGRVEAAVRRRFPCSRGRAGLVVDLAAAQAAFAQM